MRARSLSSISLAAVGALLMASSASAQSNNQDPIVAPVPVAAPVSAEPSIAPRSPDVTFQTQWRRHLLAQRARHIRMLSDYARAGVFPVNRVGTGLVNVFRDDEGHLCAVANMMWLDGQRALVDDTAASNNLVRLVTVTEGPAVAWMLRSGFTREEIGLIQEPYFEAPDPTEVSRTELLQFRRAERARLRSHFAVVLRVLTRNTQRSINTAVAALGDIVRTPPSMAIAQATATTDSTPSAVLTAQRGL